jgi:hydrogenase maturation protease
MAAAEGVPVTADPVRAIAQAVLYEGYMLWPYRRSALKNQQRFTFGGVYPEAFARVSSDRSTIRMECLIETGGECSVELTLRCLHLVARQPLRHGEPVDQLTAGGQQHLAWEEVTERELSTGWRRVRELENGLDLPVHMAAGAEDETLEPGSALRRTWDTLQGTLAAATTIVAPGLVKLAVAFSNESSWPGGERGPALRRSFLSAHVVGRCADGAFVSCTDPPETLRGYAEACRNVGLWPVLVGEEGERETILGSPIILSDYPSVAPESPGDLFDGGEIDALLIHSIRGLTDAERAEMGATDPRTREILERSLELSSEEMLRLYGAVREMRRVEH